MDKHQLLLFFLVLLSSLSGRTVLAQDNELIVEVKNINESIGMIYVGLYDSNENYLKKDTFSKSVSATQGNIQLVFTDLPFGDYAVSAIHDANSNKELDKNFIGIPKEGFGFLDGEMGSFGPPSFDKVKIEWKGGSKKIEVPLKYY